ncbi:MAG: ATP-dependent helicase [Myxococcota bacterium]
MLRDLSELIDRLNPDQRTAVLADPGPILILAGAGSGKTRVLTHRIAHMILERRIRPWNILAVTFTNKAAEEMAHRVMRLLPSASESVQVSTFHKTAAQMLRRHIDHLGYSSNFVIYDDGDQLVMLKRVVEELGLSANTHDPRLFRTLIDRAKNRLQWPKQVEVQTSGPASKLPQVYARYQEKLKAANACDFGDLLLLVVKLLEEFPEVRQYYLDRYRHLLIDEYQDTNHAQYKMAQLLSNPETRSICVVGDEDQSIYAFRGADISNILNFTKDYPDARVIKLEQNYRSTNMILKAATQVVANNEARLGKTMWTDRGDGEPLQYFEVDSDVEEAARIAEEVLRLRARIQYGDVVVLYRTNSQSRVFEEVFNTRSIPYNLVGQGFYDRKEIRDLRAYLQLIFNPLDDASLERILNEPARGIGDKARTQLFDLAAEQRVSAFQALEKLAAHNHLGVSGNRLLAFYRMIDKLKASARVLRVGELLDKILEDTGYRDKLVQQGDVESESRLENLRELANVAAEFDRVIGLEGLQLFLERISLRSQSDELKDEAGRVTLMTIHNAKGLEFPVVFLAGLEEGLFPHSRTVDNPEEVEEERRLCYVGMTRAMNRLYLSRARKRRLQGEYLPTRPSRFLKEIPAELMHGQRGAGGVAAIARRYGMSTPNSGAESSAAPWSANSSRPSPAPRPFPTGFAVPRPAPARESSEEPELPLRRPSVRSASDDDDNPFDALQPGRRIIHRQFGEGTIKEREGPADNPRLTIYFRSVGNKKVMARFAELELVYR